MSISVLTEKCGTSPFVSGQIAPAITYSRYASETHSYTYESSLHRPFLFPVYITNFYAKLKLILSYVTSSSTGDPASIQEAISYVMKDPPLAGNVFVDRQALRPFLNPSAAA